MNLREFLTKVKMIKDRALGYIGLWVYLLIIIEYFKLEVSNWFVLSFFGLCMVATVVDWIYIFPEEQNITWERNPAYHRIRDKK